MSINDLIYHVIELIVDVRRTSTSSAPFGVLVIDYRGWICEFGVLDVHASSRKLSDLEDATYLVTVILSRVTAGFCESERQDLIGVCFQDYGSQSRLTVVEVSLGRLERFFHVILGPASAGLARDSSSNSQWHTGAS